MTKRIPSLTPRQVIDALKRGGFQVHHVRGSHYALRHMEKPDVRVIVAFHNRPMKRGTLHGIIRQAGLAIEEFIDLL